MLETADFFPGRIFFRIAAGRHHNSDARSLVPLDFHFVEISINGCDEQLEQVRFQSRQNRLCLRIAKPAIELENLRTLFCHDQPGKKQSAKRNVLVRQAAEKRLNDLSFKLRLRVAQFQFSAGLIAPIPPVFGPMSSSNARL